MIVRPVLYRLSMNCTHELNLLFTRYFTCSSNLRDVAAGKCKDMELANAKSSERSFTKAPVFSKKMKSQSDSSNFVDFCYVQCVSGRGGDGKLSFLREYCLEFGGPDGGNGGNGGHVIFKADSKVTDLSNVKAIVKAAHGEMGGGKCCHGQSGEHAYIQVPVNTLIKSPSTGHRSLNEGILHELTSDGEIFIAARGGAGGHGNNFYLSNSLRKPVTAEYGGSSEIRNYELEMRTMAIAGLVGFPNAGKSSFLQAISRAKPKVASYPFTTLKAHVGMVMYDDFQQLAVADIPGLIEGAHRNEGLGFSFLRHICRCEFIFYVIDYTLGEWRAQFDALQRELDLYSRELCSSKLAAVIVNKCDLINDEKEKDQIREVFNGQSLFFVSARQRTGLEPVLTFLREQHDKNVEVKRENRTVE